MRAAYIDDFGDAGAIRIGELPDPRPGPTDVLVAVEATAVDKVDTLVRSGAFRTPVTFPFVIGRDLVGTVLRAGPGAAGFAAGDRVWCNSLGHGGRQGAAATAAVAPADRLYHLPAGADPVEAVAVLHPAATAHLALVEHGDVRPGATVLVAGAAGSVGSALTVMAREAGATVVATAREPDADYCERHGASIVVDYRDPRWADRVRTACPGGVDIYVDTSGRNELATAVDLLAHRGRVVVLAGMGGRPVLPIAPLYLKDASVRGFVISHATTAELAGAARTVNRLLAAGRLRPRRVESLPLDAAAQAHRRIAEPSMSGTRLVLHPGR